MLPKLDRKRAVFVLTRIDEILAWEKRNEQERDTRFVELGGFLNQVQPKQPRLRLDPDSYEELRQQVLRRDNWRCQACGTMTNLEAHHQEFRSHGGHDSEENLITLCSGCHSSTHSV